MAYNGVHLRRFVLSDDELFVEEPFDDKQAAVVLRSGRAKQLVEANICSSLSRQKYLWRRMCSVASPSSLFPPIPHN